MIKRLLSKPLALNNEHYKMNLEFQESGFRTLIYVTAGIMIIGYFLANILHYWTSIPQISIVILIIVGCSWVSLHYMQNNILISQLIWVSGCFFAIGAVVYFSKLPELAFLYSLLPILAATLMGGFYGILLTGALLVLIWLSPYFGVNLYLPELLGLVVLTIGVIGSLVTSSYFYSLQTFYQWVFGYYANARKEMDLTQEQRVEFIEIKEDFELANKELKRMTDQLDILYQRAEEARRVKEEFVANVSHELRTPLNMIIGFSDVIMKNPQLYGKDIPGALLADISSIHRNSQHLSRLVDDVLDLSQVEAQRMAITKAWASIQDIVQEAIGAVQALYDSKGIYLTQELPPECPPVFCDSTRLRQVVINLLSNAGRYTEEGGVFVKTWADENNVLISISDTGPGISKDDQEKIFQPFQQLGDPARRKGGSGLGLAISKQFVEMHDGEMWLESQIGVGTIFYVRIPLNTLPLKGDDFRNEWERYFKPDTQYEVRTREMKIAPTMVKPQYMLVEEGITLRRLFERYMDDIEVVSSNNIDEAVVTIGLTPIQAMIINSPEDGDELNLESSLKKIPLGIPVFTCWVPGSDEVARRLGVVNYLLKPVSQEVLVSSVQKLGVGVRRILLVDDEPDLLQLFARMLSAANPDYQILQAFDGQRALDLLRSRKPDVVLLDLIMPGVDGFQILREKRRDEKIRNVPVIVVSSINPTGETIMCNNLMITRKEGLSVHDLIGCIQASNKVLNRSPRSSVG